MKITKRQLRRIIKEELLREAYSNQIGSGDPAQEILDWAEEGNRVTIAGKNVWAGLGNRSGLHSYADELTSEKWTKSGDRFTKKIMNLPVGTEVELKRYQSANRDRGNWVTAGTVTTMGPVQSSSGGETPSSKRMREISQALGVMYDRNVKIKSVSQYVSEDAPFNGKNWEVVVGKNRMIFPDKDEGRGEYAELVGGTDGRDHEGVWEVYSAY